MRLSRGSWHVKVNDFVYGSGYSEDNTNLCPYFWGTILATLVCLPVFFGRVIADSLSMGVKNFLIKYGVGVFWIAIGIVSITLTGSPIQLIVGFIILGFEILAHNTGFFGWLFSLKKSKPKKPKPHKERKPHMTIEMFKGWKHKHCPMVTWE